MLQPWGRGGGRGGNPTNSTANNFNKNNYNNGNRKKPTFGFGRQISFTFQIRFNQSQYKNNSRPSTPTLPKSKRIVKRIKENNHQCNSRNKNNNNNNRSAAKATVNNNSIKRAKEQQQQVRPTAPSFPLLRLGRRVNQETLCITIKCLLINIK